MANKFSIGRGFEGNDIVFNADNRTYFMENLKIPHRGYLIRIRLSVFSIGKPIDLYVLKRNRRGKLKLRDKAKLIPYKTGEQNFSIKNGKLDYVKVHKNDFLGFRIRKDGGSILNFGNYQFDKVQWKRGDWDRDSTMRERVGKYIKMQAVFARLKTAFQPQDIEKGNYLIQFNNSNIEVGDFSANKFHLSIKGQKFDEDIWYRVFYTTNKVESISTESEDDIITKMIINYDGTAKFDQAVLYIKDQTLISDDGALECELIFNSKPDSNKIRLDFEFQGVNFFKQEAYDANPIPPEDASVGVDYQTETEGRAGGENGEVKVIMPPENVDSYAIYVQNPKHFDADFIENYGIGKLGHIERIKLIDAEDNWAWGDQTFNFNTMKYVITMPQDFLDNSVYPIRVDPTFGYTTLGGTSWQVEDVLIGYVANPGEFGCCCDLYAGIDYWINNDPVKMALYDDAQSLLLSPQSEERDDGHATAQYEQFPIVPPVGGGILVENKSYIIAAWFGGDTDIRRDNLGIPNTSKYVNITYDGWPVNPTFLGSTNAYSTYAFYNQVTPLNWGIVSQVVNNTFSPDYIMYMGGITPDTPDIIARQIWVRVTTTSSVAVALYSGGSLDNPTGAIKITEAYAVPVVAGWNAINVNPVVVPNNSVVWIGVCIGDANSIYYSDQPTDSGDFQSIRGNWRDTLPENHDANTPLPINPQPGSFENNYLQVYLKYTVDPNYYITGDITFQDMTMQGGVYRGYTAQASITFEEMEFQGNATPRIDCEADITFEEMEFQGEATPRIDCEADITFEEMTMIGEATQIFRAQANITFEEMTMVGEAGQIFRATSDITFEEMTMLASASQRFFAWAAIFFEEMQFQGNANMATLIESNITFEEMEMSGDVIFYFVCEANISFEEMTMDCTVLNFAPYEITADINFEEMQFQGNVQTWQITEITGDITFEEMTMAGEATPRIDCEADITFEEMTMVGNATPRIECEADITFEEMEFQGEATPRIDCEADITFEEMTMVGEATPVIRGHLNAIFEEMTMTGIVAMHGRITADITFEEMTMSGYVLLQENPISEDLFRYSLIQSLKCIFSGLIIWQDEDGPQPKDPFVSLRIENFATLSPHDSYKYLGDSDTVMEYIGDRSFELAIEYIGDYPIETLETIRNWLHNHPNCEWFELGKMVFLSTTDIVNTTVAEDIKTVPRGEFSVIFGTYAQYRRDLPTIKRIEAKACVDTGDKIREIDISTEE